MDRLRFVLISLAGWMNQQQQYAIDYLREENRVLREQLGGRRLRGSPAASTRGFCTTWSAFAIHAVIVSNASARTAMFMNCSLLLNFSADVSVNRAGCRPHSGFSELRRLTCFVGARLSSRRLKGCGKRVALSPGEGSRLAEIIPDHNGGS